MVHPCEDGAPNTMLSPDYAVTVSYNSLSLFFFAGLHLEPLHQPFFVKVFFKRVFWKTPFTKGFEAIWTGLKS
jgi:hypothetical protein